MKCPIGPVLVTGLGPVQKNWTGLDQSNLLSPVPVQFQYTIHNLQLVNWTSPVLKLNYITKSNIPVQSSPVQSSPKCPIQIYKIQNSNIIILYNKFIQLLLIIYSIII